MKPLQHLFCYPLVGLILLASCTNKTEQMKDVNRTIDITEPIAPVTEIKAMLYVNKVGYFADTDEFFVSLMSKKPMSEADFDLLSKKADSAVVDNVMETGRFRLPMAAAEEAFDLSNLGEVKVYSDDHQFITNAKLRRVEYIIDMNAYFVAVFKPENPIPKDDRGFYCLGMGEVNLTDIHSKVVNREDITERIKKELVAAPQYVWKVEHVNIQPDNVTYSVAAFQLDSGETVSYLTEYKEDQLRVLYTLKEDYVLYGIQPVHIEQNGKPVLLLHLVLPDSDAVDDYVVATYDGQQYQLTEGYNIKIR